MTPDISTTAERAVADYQSRGQDRRAPSLSPFQSFLQYAGLGSLLLLGIAWGVLDNKTETNQAEIRELRAMNLARMQQDVITARDMATKEDIRDINKKLDDIQILVTRK